MPFAALLAFAGFAAASPAPAASGRVCASLPVAAPPGARIQSVQAVQQQGGRVSFPQTPVDPRLPRTPMCPPTARYRLFLDPGVGHCGSEATGPVPTDPLAAVVNWVEHGKAPATLPAAITNTAGTTSTRDLCAYPMVSRYTGGDPSVATSYRCMR